LNVQLVVNDDIGFITEFTFVLWNHARKLVPQRAKIISCLLASLGLSFGQLLVGTDLSFLHLSILNYGSLAPNHMIRTEAACLLASGHRSLTAVACYFQSVVESSESESCLSWQLPDILLPALTKNTTMKVSIIRVAISKQGAISPTNKASVPYI
jgi:hypothetical protein